MSAVELVNNERNDDKPALKAGDFVDVRFRPTEGFLGYVVSASTERLRLHVHQVSASTFNASDCLDWDMVIPMTSILWIRHLPAKPMDCPCNGNGKS